MRVFVCWHTFFGSIFPNQPLFCLKFSFFLFVRFKQIQVDQINVFTKEICDRVNTVCLAFQIDMVASRRNSLAGSYIHVY